VSDLRWTSDGVAVLRGAVELGDQRGRTLGFPTANIPLEGGDLDDGVWAGWVHRAAGTRHAAAISVGRRSTIYGRRGVRLLEAHLLDFDEDLYGERVAVWLSHRLREQRRFSSLDALKAQLIVDVAACRAWCQSAGVAVSLPGGGA
jgi:riboflavin kinase/FMN adenylyltransferase